MVLAHWLLVDAWSEDEMIELDPFKSVLIPSGDHSYRTGTIREAKVVWNPKAKRYFEYFGDEHLGECEEVVTRYVVE